MYEKVKKFTIWIPLIGILLAVVFEKEIEASMYENYFDWGSPLLVLLSAIWQGLSVSYLVFLLI